jgi:elongation factor G
VSIGTAQLRNVVLVSHGGAGKTSLVEALAFTAGAISRQGRVEDGNTVSDFDPDEQKRGMSVNTAVVSFDVDAAGRPTRINLIDTPGYADFVGDVIAGAAAADTALILVDAAAGVQVGTETAWRLAEHRHMPRAIVVSRLDRENARWDETVAAIQAQLGPQCQPLQIPIGLEDSFIGVIDVLHRKAYLGDGREASDIPGELAAVAAAAREGLAERIAEADDDLTLRFLEGEELSDAEIENGLSTAITSGTVIPIFCASSTANIGSMPLIRAIRDEFPSPLDVAPVEAEVAGIKKSLPADPGGPVAALVFKTSADEFVGRLTYFRVFSGTVRTDAHLYNHGRDEDERLANLSNILGKDLRHTDAVIAGDIGAVTKLSATRTFDTLGDKATPVHIPPPALPTPVFSAAITPITKADVDKLGPGLQRLLEEDPTLHMQRDQETAETILSGLGESHVDIAAETLRRKFKVEVDVHDRRIPYRETITGKAQAEYTHKKQTGGHGQYARVAIRVEPRGRGDGFEFGNEVVGGNVPRQFIPAVEKGVTEALLNGSMSDYPLTDLRVVLFDGKHHDVDSSEMAFRLAASQALKEATGGAHPILLEPIMTCHVHVPESATGDVMSDLNARRARVLGMEPVEPGTTTISAEGSMAEFLHYATDLRSITGGRGYFELKFTRYDPVPEHVAQKLVAASKETARAAV